MQVIINGEARELEAGTSLTGFLHSRNLRPQMVVVERNGDIVARGLYDSTFLADGDVLEIVQMMAGG